MKLSDLMSKILRLSTLERFNTRPRLSCESVAEHSFFVSIISMVISEYFARNFSDVLFCRQEVLIMSMIHDLPELEYSDIPHDVKNKIPELKENLVFYEINFFETKMNQDLYKQLIANDTLEANIVNFADILAVKYYSEREIDLGNTYFKDINKETETRLQRFKDSITDEIIRNMFKQLMSDSGFNYNWRSLI